jgi:hypothetical protein
MVYARVEICAEKWMNLSEQVSLKPLTLIESFSLWTVLQVAGTPRTLDCSQCSAYVKGACSRCPLCNAAKYIPCTHCDFQFGRSLTHQSS